MVAASGTANRLGSFRCIIDIRGFVGEDVAGFGGVAVEAFVLDAGGWVVLGGGFVGLLPVAFAVPEVAGLVVVPEGVVLGPDAVVELLVFFAAVDGTGGEPFDVGHELAVLGGVPGCPLFGGAGSCDGSNPQTKISTTRFLPKKR